MDWLDQYLVKMQSANTIALMDEALWNTSMMGLNLLVDFGNLMEASMTFENADMPPKPVPPEAVRRYRAYKWN